MRAIIEIFKGLFTDGFWGWVMGILLVLSSLVILCLIGWGILYLVDSVGIEEKNGIAKVETTWHSDPYTSTTLMHVGKSLIPITHYHPEAWHMSLSVNSLADDVTISSDDFAVIRNGQLLKVEYSQGRIWNSLYIISYELP